jgi:hypothetical protein
VGRVLGGGGDVPDAVEVLRRFVMAAATTVFGTCGGYAVWENQILISESGLLMSGVVRSRLF